MGVAIPVCFHDDSSSSSLSDDSIVSFEKYVDGMSSTPGSVR